MHKFKVFFNVYNKKICTTVEAEDEADAKEKILNKIVFDKIDRVYFDSNYENAKNVYQGNATEQFKDLPEDFLNIFGMKK